MTKFVKQQLDKCKKDNYEQQAYLNISYYAGKQWIVLEKTSGLLVEPAKEPWQIRYIANKIQPIVRTELAKLTKNHFIMFVAPATNEDSDIKSARVADKVCSWLEYELGLQAVDRENCLWGLTTGVSFVKPYWNPSKGEKLIDFDGTEMHQGDVDCCVVSLFELKFDTSYTRWEELPWICHEKIRSVEDIKARYGVDVEPELGLTATNLYEAKIANLSTVNTSGIEFKNFDNSAVVHEYWELPSAQYPKGRRITTCSDKVLLYEEDIGFGEQDQTPRELPFFPFVHIQVPGRLIPTSVVEQIIPIQREYNKSRSQIIENKNLMANPQWVVMEGSVDDEITNRPGGVITYKAGYQEPKVVQMPPMGADVYQNIELCDREFEFVSGQHETSHGSTPSGVTSGTAIGYLQEQDDTKLGPTIANFIACKQRYMRYMMKMIQQKYDVGRTVRLVGENKKTEVFSFKGSDLTSIDVRVQESTMYQTSKAAKQDFILKLVQYNLLSPEKDKELILKALEIGITDSVYDEYEIDTTQAQTENDKWAAGDMSPIVRDFYNHEVHVKEHNKFRKGESYNNLDMGLKMLVDLHVTEHLEYLMNQMLGMQSMQEPQVNPAQPQPQGTLPNNP